MSYLDHWSLDPFLIFAVILVAWHEIGLARLSRSDPEHAGKRRLRSVAFYAGLAVVLLAVDSPVEYFADRYFFMHMLQHLLLMFAAPSLLVAGAPWQPLADAVPSRAAAVVVKWSGPLRAAVDFLLRPWVTVVAFNVVMLFWHIPAALDLAENNPAVKIWLLHSSYLIVGILFWLLFIPSPPLRMRMPPEGQAIALVATNVIMWLLAMSMSFLTRRPGTRSTTTFRASPCRRSPISRSARASCGSAATSGPSRPSSSPSAGSSTPTAAWAPRSTRCSARRPAPPAAPGGPAGPAGNGRQLSRPARNSAQVRAPIRVSADGPGISAPSRIRRSPGSHTGSTGRLRPEARR